jgi:glycosyltransferase-like protein
MSLRVAILAHSTNPRGGVVHALELAEALVALGHEAVVHAPDPRGRGFFRKTACQTVSVAARAAGADLREMVDTRVAEYVEYFEKPGNRGFDVYHAQDGISGNALATLKDAGLIPGFARTIHHVDVFEDPAVDALQTRSIILAGAWFVVSAKWRRNVRSGFAIDSTIVGNGVNVARFVPGKDGSENALRRRLRVGPGPVVLAVGGVEPRKNATRLLVAFAALRGAHPGARLVIAGGASLFGHDDYRRAHALAAAELALPPGAVVETGPLPDADMPALYRMADVLAFPSVEEGFGLVVLEAMACGTPVVVSRIEPFTEYLGDLDVEWCDPFDVRSIRDAIDRALWPPHRAGLVSRGADVAARFDWRRVAEAHLPVYERLAADAASAAPPVDSGAGRVPSRAPVPRKGAEAEKARPAPAPATARLAASKA